MVGLETVECGLLECQSAAESPAVSSDLHTHFRSPALQPGSTGHWNRERRLGRGGAELVSFCVHAASIFHGTSSIFPSIALAEMEP